ncbi:MAG: cbdA 2 [Myxococcaceae bacterium]|nr:cbdA 2 [Myxococcaceae bacterium]
MFVTTGAHEPKLRPEDYASPTTFEAERQAVFSRGWHLVATRAQLATPGAFVATDVAGLPVLVRNESGELCAFVNVCAHRHSLLEAAGCGVRDRLRCRYHGWEYDSDGQLSKLPDGASFRGLKAARLSLRKLRVDTLGPLVYVGLSSEDAGLREWLGPVAAELSPFYERALAPLFIRTTEHDVNWKIIVENAVESYHVPLVHPGTFRYYRPPALHDHRLEPTFTRYADLEPWSSSHSGRAVEAFARLLLVESDGQRFRHAHRFPNQLFYYGDLFCDVSVVTPIGPTRSRHTCFAFLADDLRLRGIGRPLMRLFGRLMKRQSARVFAEDLTAWLAVQTGTAHAREPGVLSAREERVWAFQSWLSEQLVGAGERELVTLRSAADSANARTKGR